MPIGHILPNIFEDVANGDPGPEWDIDEAKLKEIGTLLARMWWLTCRGSIEPLLDESVRDLSLIHI